MFKNFIFKHLKQYIDKAVYFTRVITIVKLMWPVHKRPLQCINNLIYKTECL